MAPLLKVVTYVEGLFKECQKMERKFGANHFHQTRSSYHVVPQGQHAETADAICAAINTITPGRVFVVDGSSATDDSFLFDLGQANLLSPSLVVVKFLDQFCPQRAVADRVAASQVSAFLTGISGVFLPHSGACVVGLVSRVADLSRLVFFSSDIALVP